MKKISIIIPCYYNELNIPVTKLALIENEALFVGRNVEFEYVMVDDGSKDNTYIELQKFQSEYPEKVKVAKLVKNVGSYVAIIAGMEVATGDCMVIIAADLQDPIELTLKMYDYWEKGFKLVLANREERPEGFIQKSFSNGFHALMKKYAIPEMPKGGFDFLFFDKEIKDIVLQSKEKNSNCLYLIVSLGYEFVSIPYKRKERKLGVSKWTMSKKLKLTFDSFVSFTHLPLRMISIMGLIFGFCAMLYSVIILISYFFGNISISGWTALMLVLLSMGSFMFFSIGILGEYLWRILDNTKQRPMYIIDKEKSKL